jgi:hypothetical protein
MLLINIYRLLLQIADSGKPIQIMAKSFLVFPARNRFSDFFTAIGLMPLTDSGNWLAAKNSSEL